MGLLGIQKKVLGLHEKAFRSDILALPVGGIYRYRRGGEAHAWEASLIHMLQTAVGSENYALFKKYTAGLRDLPPISVRDLLEIKPAGPAIPKIGRAPGRERVCQ